jgi:seryl-tRNA synthetase
MPAFGRHDSRISAMHDIRSIRENPQEFDKALARRNLSEADRERFSSKNILAIDEERRKTIFLVEQWQEKRNRLSKEIGLAKKAKDEAKVADLMDQVSRLKSDITHAGEQVVTKIEQKLGELLQEIPNLPLGEVPNGTDEHGNELHHVFGNRRNYAFTPKPHDDIGAALGFMDFETAAKLSGARFVVLTKGLARLERAIGQFMLDVHTTEHGYTEVNPPLMVNPRAMFGTGQLPKFEEDQFFTNSLDGLHRVAALTTAILDKDPDPFSDTFKHQLSENMKFDGRWLIPTAEVPLTNMVRESIVDEKQLPMRLTALTPCFRAEAGAAGRDTRGMIRQHQFIKCELVSITTPETSMDEHERMLACAEEVLRRLGLHYRVMTLCTGDMGFSSQKTYDIEVWMPGQGDGGAFREISSCSVCGDFQARRMDARYRATDGKPRFVHTLNGSGTAVGRAMIAIMETYQQGDGSIAVPEVLQPYMSGLKTIAREN